MSNPYTRLVSLMQCKCGQRKERLPMLYVVLIGLLIFYCYCVQDMLSSKIEQNKKQQEIKSLEHPAKMPETPQ